MGSIDDGDPNTTNIYLGNLPTKVTSIVITVVCLYFESGCKLALHGGPTCFYERKDFNWLCKYFLFLYDADFGATVNGNLWKIWSISQCEGYVATYG